jgi:hypothetical protein
MPTNSYLSLKEVEKLMKKRVKWVDQLLSTICVFFPSSQVLSALLSADPLYNNTAKYSIKLVVK